MERINVGEEADKAHWPTGVRAITVGQIDKLGVSPNGQLYWDGKEVEVRRRLDLTLGERWFALIVGGFTILGSLGAVIQAGVAAHQWGCESGYTQNGCPKQ